MSKEANDALFNAIHNEFHRCVDLLRSIREHNLNLPDQIKNILENNESLCLDNENDRKVLYEKLISVMKLDIIDNELRSDPTAKHDQQIDLFDISYLDNNKDKK